jgi:hypothetical protein
MRFDPLVANGVDQLSSGGIRALKAPFGKVVGGTQAIIAEQGEILVTAETARPAGWHAPMVPDSSPVRQAVLGQFAPSPGALTGRAETRAS